MEIILFPIIIEDTLKTFGIFCIEISILLTSSQIQLHLRIIFRTKNLKVISPCSQACSN